ncbi:MAG: methylenetetrahydrofolate reductase C-terminal domain-containing protein [Desulfobacterales bacterium]
MIIANRKPLEEILEMIKNCKKVLLLGCRGCVTVCNVGGEKEVEILAATLRIARKKESDELEIHEKSLERQCDPEYIEQIKDTVKNFDAVLSMACGVGPQFLSECFPEQRFYPMVNTTFMGGGVAHGIWEERCAGCGTCIIHYYEGMCPIARCAKSLLHGPCGGSAGGKCEIDNQVVCIWNEIVQKKMERGRLEELLELKPLKDWRTARDGGPRKRAKEELA